MMQTHIIVCPFCDNGQPVPLDFDSIHRCRCGACFKVCGSQTLDSGLGDIADELWTDVELELVRSVQMDFCNVIVEKNFDRLLALKQVPDGVERFCKYDSNMPLSLVWVKRLL